MTIQRLILWSAQTAGMGLLLAVSSFFVAYNSTDFAVTLFTIATYLMVGGSLATAILLFFVAPFFIKRK